jgi:uncharacterized protein YigE (DUF2233 family)
MENEYQFKITSIVFDKKETKEAFRRILSLLISERIEKVEITYGFAWGNDIYEAEWLPIGVAPSKIEAMVEVESQKGSGAIGSDDFYITINSEAIQIQVCHENDIHIEYNTESALLTLIKTAIHHEEWAWKKEKG